MADPKTLAKFTLSEAGDGYRLHIQTEDGAILDLLATPEQLDVIAESIDQLLGDDDSADAVDGDDEDDDDD